MGDRPATADPRRAPGFEWDRPAPVEWQTDLERLAPRSDQTNWLWLQWLPGWPYAPVQRWGIYEMTPGAVITSLLHELGAGPVGLQWQDLHGPDPREHGHFYAAADGTTRWRSHSVVSYAQWRAHQATGGYPTLVWIVEGDFGGHAWQLGPMEWGLFKLGGLSASEIATINERWPNPGDQPYAPYDQRTFAALAERDRLRRWRQAAPWTSRLHRTRAGLVMERDEAEARLAFGKAWLKWVENQIADLVSDAPRTQVVKFVDAAAPAWAPVGDEGQLDRAILLGDAHDRT